jgi:hypothetical protein
MSNSELDEVGRKWTIVTLKKLSIKDGKKTHIRVGKERTFFLNKPIKRGHVIMEIRYFDNSRTTNSNGTKTYEKTSTVLRITPTEKREQFEVETSTSIYSAIIPSLK